MRSLYHFTVARTTQLIKMFGGVYSDGDSVVEFEGTVTWNKERAAEPGE